MWCDGERVEKIAKFWQISSRLNKAQSQLLCVATATATSNDSHCHRWRQFGTVLLGTTSSWPCILISQGFSKTWTCEVSLCLLPHLSYLLKEKPQEVVQQTTKKDYRFYYIYICFHTLNNYSRVSSPKRVVLVKCGWGISRCSGKKITGGYKQ
jgi:hypothetical protein